MDKKYQIFVSSTFVDLKDERQAVSRSILDMGHIPAGMEMFPATDIGQMEYIRKVIDQCDYYVLIIGARYGSADAAGVSYTEQEYRYAVETGKVVLAFLHRNIDLIPLGKSDKDDAKRQKLEEFRNTVSEGRLVQHWDGVDDLSAKAIISLTRSFSESPRIGWVRADTVASADTMAETIKYRNENDQLKAQIANFQQQLAPRFDDVAGLDSLVDIKYTYWVNSRSGRSKTGGMRTTTYLELLKWIAPAAFNPTALMGIRSAIGKALQERLGIEKESLMVVESSALDAMLHLSATGHIKIWSSTKKDGNHVTGYKLTPVGVKVWQEASYKRASQ